MRKDLTHERSYLLDTEPIPSGFWMIHDKRTERVARAGAGWFKFLTYHGIVGRVLAYRAADG